MRVFKWWEKLLMILLTPLFIVSYFLVFVTSVKPIKENPAFFFFVCIAITPFSSVFFQLKCNSMR